MLQQMPDGGQQPTSEGPGAPQSAGGELAVARLTEMSADLRSCAVLDGEGRLLAASRPDRWEELAAELWEAAAESGVAEPEQVHVARDGGELFAVRSPAGTAIALTDRFALASLMLCDLRAALRDLAPGDKGGAGAGAPSAPATASGSGRDGERGGGSGGGP